MAIAWSRISSKVIAHPPEPNAACRRRCGNWRGRSDVCIPHMVDRRKQEVLGARDTAVTPLAQTRGGMWHVHVGRLLPPQIHTAPGVHHVLHHPTRQKTRESQKASLP